MALDLSKIWKFPKKKEEKKITKIDCSKATFKKLKEDYYPLQALFSYDIAQSEIDAWVSSFAEIPRPTTIKNVELLLNIFSVSEHDLTLKAVCTSQDNNEYLIRLDDVSNAEELLSLIPDDRDENRITTEEFFNKICDILEENGQMPDILYRGMPLYYPLPIPNTKYELLSIPAPIKTPEFHIRNELNYGCNGDIILNLWIEQCVDGKLSSYRLGTFRAMDNFPEAMRTMGQLLANFIIAGKNYVNEHLEDFM